MQQALCLLQCRHPCNYVASLPKAELERGCELCIVLCNTVDVILDFTDGTDVIGLDSITFDELTIAQGTGNYSSHVVITKKVSEELGLNSEFPFLEVRQRVKNKSFVAKKAEMFNEEKKVFDKAPVTKIKIDNISKAKNKKNKKQIMSKKFSILIGEFYSKESANNLRNNLRYNKLF